MNILIADDHAIVRKGLIQLLHEEYPFAEFSEAAHSNDVCKLSKSRIWDFILLDVSMPGRNGLEILKQLRADGIKAPVLMLSMHPEEQYALRALKAGASGFINKEIATEELISAVHKVLAGRKHISASLAEKLAEDLSGADKPAYEKLSDREMQVCQLLAAGKQVSEIAQEISLSVNTISTYRSRVLEKLGLHNNADITRYAIEHHLI